MLVKHLRKESSTMAAAPSESTWLVLRASRKMEGLGPALQTEERNRYSICLTLGHHAIRRLGTSTADRG
jgi:hypothetical protein